MYTDLAFTGIAIVLVVIAVILILPGLTRKRKRKHEDMPEEHTGSLADLMNSVDACMLDLEKSKNIIETQPAHTLKMNPPMPGELAIELGSQDAISRRLIEISQYYRDERDFYRPQYEEAMCVLLEKQNTRVYPMWPDGGNIHWNRYRND